MSRGFTRTGAAVRRLVASRPPPRRGSRVPGAWRAAADAAPPRRRPGAGRRLRQRCSPLALAWPWLVTSVTVAEVVTGVVPRSGGATRRLVLVACGAAVGRRNGARPPGLGRRRGPRCSSGLAAARPRRRAGSRAAPGCAGRPDRDGAGLLRGRPGDSLWSIARAHPERRPDVDARWRAIWRPTATSSATTPT